MRRQHKKPKDIKWYQLKCFWWGNALTYLCYLLREGFPRPSFRSVSHLYKLEGFFFQPSTVQADFSNKLNQGNFPFYLWYLLPSLLQEDLGIKIRVHLHRAAKCEVLSTSLLKHLLICGRNKIIYQVDRFPFTQCLRTLRAQAAFEAPCRAHTHRTPKNCSSLAC